MSTPEDPFDTRLRDGLVALVGEAEVPPPFPGHSLRSPDPQKPGFNGRGVVAGLVGAAAAMALVAALVLVIRQPEQTDQVNAVGGPTTSVLGTTSASTGEPGSADRPLVGTEWRLVALERAGSSEVVPADTSAVIRFAPSPCGENGCSGEVMMSGSDGCNAFTATVSIAENRLETSEFQQTLAACNGAVGEVGSVVSRALSKPITYVISGADLVLTAADGSAFTYAAPNAAVAESQGNLLVGGTIADGTYRFSWDRGPGRAVSVQVSVQTSGTDEPVNSRFTDGPGNPGTAAWAPIDDSLTFVMGLESTSTASVTLVPPFGPSVDLPVYALPSETGLVSFGGFVSSAKGDWTMITRDAKGNELTRKVTKR